MELFEIAELKERMIALDARVSALNQRFVDNEMADRARHKWIKDLEARIDAMQRQEGQAQRSQGPEASDRER